MYCSVKKNKHAVLIDDPFRNGTRKISIFFWYKTLIETTFLMGLFH